MQPRAPPRDGRHSYGRLQSLVESRICAARGRPVSLFDTVAPLEEDDNLHVGRLLVFLSAFAGKDGKGSVDGITKLAKLDFLLRYPVHLERALQVRAKRGIDANVVDYERKSSARSRLTGYLNRKSNLASFV